jgi:hypothetical protein
MGLPASSLAYWRRYTSLPTTLVDQLRAEGDAGGRMWKLSVERAPEVVDGFQQWHDANRGWHVVDEVPAGVAIGPVQQRPQSLPVPSQHALYGTFVANQGWRERIFERPIPCGRLAFRMRMTESVMKRDLIPG